MAPTGIDKDSLLSALSKAGHDVLFNTALREKLPIQQEYNASLTIMVDALKHAALAQDAGLSIKAERICVEFEKEQASITPNEQKRYEKQISELASADNSLALVSDPERYKSHIVKGGVSYSAELLPQGEAYLSHARKQIQYLAQAKKGIRSELEKEFMLARQDNLRAGIKDFQERQRIALINS